MKTRLFVSEGQAAHGQVFKTEQFQHGKERPLVVSVEYAVSFMSWIKNHLARQTVWQLFGHCGLPDYLVHYKIIFVVDFRLLLSTMVHSVDMGATKTFNYISNAVMVINSPPVHLI